jgi:hypothetical protein
VVQNSLNPLVTKEMHLSFESLAIIDTPSLQASLMNIYHDTSFRYILENDFISLESKAYIHSCLGKRVELWLIVRPFICSFRITHFNFTSSLRFRFCLIQPLASNIFTCECGHGLNASSTLSIQRSVDSHT